MPDYSEIKVCREEGEILATELGVAIPGDIRIEFWTLPLLKALLKRIKYLEIVVNKLESTVLDLELEEGG